MATTANIDRVKGLGALQASCGDAAGVTIAVLDGPVETAHPAFGNAHLSQLDVGVRAADAATPSRAHGTHVASVLFGRTDGPVVGVASGCQGLLIPIFADTSDGGIRPCSEADLASALRAAVDHGAQVINISAGRLSGNGVAGAHLDDAIRHCIDSGALVIAAAGNDGCDCLQVPAALPGVLVVGAMDDNGKPVGFSNWGAAYRDRGVLAPGTDIVGASPSGDVVTMSGTSFATPLVAGVAALMMARQLARGGPADGRVILNAIVAGADPCDPESGDRCERHLAGGLNVTGALERLDAQTASPHPAMAGETILQPNRPTGSEAMEQDRIGTSHADDGGGDPPSTQAMAEQLKAIQSTLAGLAQTLGGLQPAGMPAPEVEPAAGASTPVAEALPPATRSQVLAPARAEATTLQPAACCEACAANEARQLVFALGKLSYDFGGEARMDSIQAQMRGATTGGKSVFGKREPSASNPADMVDFLRADSSVSVTPALNWTLNLNDTPIYAIKPEGYYVQETYKALVDTLDEQTSSATAAAADEKAPPPIERMSVPGVINGQVELINGLVVPTVRPALGGMFTWRTKDLIEALGKFKPAKDALVLQEREGSAFNPQDGLRTFLNRIYEEMRNTGLAPQDRALNFAATNAYQANDIFVKLRGGNLHIEKFEVVRSPVMRPDSDCWDVKMTFYNPAAPTTQPRQIYFYTIDVSDVVPVAVGKPRHWTTY